MWRLTVRLSKQQTLLLALATVLLLSGCGGPARRNTQSKNGSNSDINENVFGLLSASSSTVEVGAQASFTVTAVVPSSLASGSVYYRRLPDGAKTPMTSNSGSFTASYQTTYATVGAVIERVEIGVDSADGFPTVANLTADLNVVAAGSGAGPTPTPGAILGSSIGVTFNPGNSVAKNSNLSAQIILSVDAGVAPVAVYVNGEIKGQLGAGGRTLVVSTVLPTNVVGSQNAAIRVARANGEFRDFSYPYTVNDVCVQYFSRSIYRSTNSGDGKVDFTYTNESAAPTGYAFQGTQFQLSGSISCGCTPVMLSRYRVVIGTRTQHAVMRAESAGSLASAGWVREADLGYACSASTASTPRRMALYYNQTTWAYLLVPRDDAGMTANGYRYIGTMGYVP